MTINPLRAATLGVADLAASVARYRQWLDYSTVETGLLDAGLAQSFGAPESSGARFAVLRPASGIARDIRLIETPPVAGYRALRTYGWAAIEICIQDVHAVHERMKGSPFEIIGPPVNVSGLPTIHPMQVQSPDGEVIFLTQIKQGGPGSGLPDAHAAIDTLFICVLACRDMPTTARWLADQLGAELAAEIAIPYRTVSRAFGFPPERLHRIATASQGGHIFLEFDQYPDEATERPCAPGSLPPGVSVVTVLHENLDAIAGPWLTRPVRRDGAIYEGRRTGVLRAPEGALIEIVENA